jgi:hydroxymethylbilane synthase
MRIGSRGSQLALWQANHIAARLRALGYDVTIEIIRTTGDALQHVTFARVSTELGGKGIFTKEIEEALREGRIDLAVHSLKDLPTELDPAFTLAAIPERVDPRDALLSARYASLAGLPHGARVGTSSERRRAQLLVHRPDLQFQEFRGNVDTRIRKMVEGQADAIILASAGLERLGLTEYRRECFAPGILCPAAGQGALAIETRADDAATLAALASLDHPATRYAVTAERAALAALGGGCQVPIGVHCAPVPGSGSAYSIQGVVAGAAAAKAAASAAHPVIRVELENQHGILPQALGRQLAEELLRQGAQPFA